MESPASSSLLFALGGLGLISFIASMSKAWANIRTETGLTFRQWLRVTTLGSVETDGGVVAFLCPEHGLQRDTKHGYNDSYEMPTWGHTLVFSDGTYCDCPRCLEELA